MSWLRNRRPARVATEATEVSTPSDLTRQRARHWLASAWFDRDFVELLLGRSHASSFEAACDFVETAMPDALPSHPLLDVLSLPEEVERDWRRSRVRRVLDHLDSLDALASVGERSAAERLDAVEHQWAVARRLAEERSRGLADASSQDDWLSWPDLGTGLDQRLGGRVSVVIPTYADARMTVAAVRSVLACSGDHDIEVVVVDNGSPDAVALSLEAAFSGLRRVLLLRLPVNLNFAAGSNVGFGASTGATVVFLNNDTQVSPGWLDGLLAPLADPAVAGVQPLLVYADGTIQTAGTVFLRDDLLPCHFLAGEDPARAEVVAGMRFSAVTAAALAMRAEDVVALRGFDTGFRNGFEDVDLCLRALTIRSGGFRVTPSSVVTHLESKSPGRFAHAMDNRRFFRERWGSRLPEPDTDLYAQAGLRLVDVDGDGTPVPAAVPTVERLPG